MQPFRTPFTMLNFPAVASNSVLNATSDLHFLHNTTICEGTPHFLQDNPNSLVIYTIERIIFFTLLEFTKMLKINLFLYIIFYHFVRLLFV